MKAAIETANWLISVEVEEPSSQGLSWPRSTSSSYRMTGLDEGSAGIGEFFLKLFRATHDTIYLEKAERASNYVYSEYLNGNFNGPDWLAGAAGGGIFFVDMYRETGNLDYLHHARFVADWLMQTVYADSSGYHWRHSPTFPKLYTGIAHGAAGIGMFFLDLFSESSDSNYLDYAEGAFRWTTDYIVRFGPSSIGWKRLTTDTVAYHQWCGGSAGIIFFINRLYQITHKDVYRQYLEQTAEGLRENSVSNGGGLAWHYTTDDYYSYPIIYCHGTSSVTHALYLASQTLADTTFRSSAQMGAHWLVSAKKSSNSGGHYWAHILDWDQFDTGLFTGTASVGHAFLKYYEIEKDSTYEYEAKCAGAYLLSVADHPSNGRTRWIDYTSANNPDYDQKTYYTGLYSGSAGVGYYLVELYESMMQAGDPGTPLPNLHPVSYAVLSNYPNPFNPGTNLTFDIPADSPISIDIYDLLGRKVQTLVESTPFGKGVHVVAWDGSDNTGRRVASGVYLAKLVWSGGSLNHKIVLIK